MSHIVTNKSSSISHHVRRPLACVKVTVMAKKPPTLCLEGGVSILKVGTQMEKLPDNVVVQTSDGEILKPSGQFWITATTIDPHHVLVDISDPTMIW